MSAVYFRKIGSIVATLQVSVAFSNSYAVGRIIFKAKGSDSKFGALQAPATNQSNNVRANLRN